MSMSESGRGSKREKASGQMGQGSMGQCSDHTYERPQSWHRLRVSDENKGLIQPSGKKTQTETYNETTVSLGIVTSCGYSYRGPQPGWLKTK